MKQKSISLIGMPMDLGQGRRGVDMGPSAIRYASAQSLLESLGYDVEDLGDLPFQPRVSSSGRSKVKVFK